MCACIRDWSLITGRGGATKWENCGSETFWAPHPQNRVPPPFNMAKTLSYLYCIKTTPKLCVPPPPPTFSMAKTFSAPHFHRGKTSHAPPSRFVAPLSIIIDQSLKGDVKRNNAFTWWSGQVVSVYIQNITKIH